MLYFVYDLPNWLFCVLCVGSCIAVSVTGMLLTRPVVRHILGPGVDYNDIVSYFLSACGVFYGITLGLIAVGAWSTFVEVDTKVSNEASALAALYRDVSSYPEPSRTVLTDQLKEYTRYVIDEAWPLQRKGIVPKGGTERLTTFQNALYAFEPATKKEEIIHAESLTQFNALIVTRRLRLQAVSAGLPSALWAVVGVGAALSIMLTWLFRCDNTRLHILLVAITAGMIGLLIFMTAAMDNPFRGEISIGPDAFITVRDQLMK
jgi:hypothetical protein